MKIYVGSLPHSATEDAVRELFASHGAVESVRIMVDKFTGQPRGFAFVDMPNNDEATNAIHALNDINFEGSQIRVNEARPPRQFNNGGPRREGGFGGPRGGGSRGGFGGPRRSGPRSGGY